MNSKIWEAQNVENGETFEWRHSSFELFIHRSINDWFIFSQRNDINTDVSISVNPTEMMSAEEGERWAFSKGFQRLKISPCLPDRPLVVRPIHPLNLPPSSATQFYIEIPIWIKVEIGNKTRFEEVKRIETQKLSNTWFGDKSEGIFCYANRSFISRSLPERNKDCNNILCLFKIINNSKEPLAVDRICIHVKYISVYETSEGLCSNDIKATFWGGGRGTVVEHSKLPPSFAENPTLLHQSEEKPEKSYSLQTFLHKGLFVRGKRDKDE